MREEHLDHVQTVLQLLQKAGLQLKKSKCKWYHDEIEFYGFQIDQEEMPMSESKTRALTGCLRTRIAEQVCGFLSPMVHYCKFIGHYAQIGLPLCRMYKMGKNVKMGGHHGEPRLKDVGIVEFAWNTEAEEA
jgi:hypothetical protein